LTAILTLLALSAAFHLAGTGDATANTCRAPMAKLEQRYRVPRNLLDAIGLTESGYTNPETSEFAPWPWTVYSEGQGRYHGSKADAVADVQELKRRGVKNIDVGCMQINLKYHPRAFQNLDEAFDPQANVEYAAQFLAKLKAEHKSWGKTIAHYHSSTKAFGNRYRQKVMKNWNVARSNSRQQILLNARANHVKRRNDAKNRRNLIMASRQQLAQKHVRIRVPQTSRFRSYRASQRNPNVIVRRRR
jgi:hypothetical protein